MDRVVHGDLASGRWYTLSLAQQLGNIGSEINRVNTFFKRNEKEKLEKAFERALELIDLTLSDIRWKHRLREITRSRELLCSLFFDTETYSDVELELDQLNEYFLQFGLLANTEKNRSAGKL